MRFVHAINLGGTKTANLSRTHGPLLVMPMHAAACHIYIYIYTIHTYIYNIHIYIYIYIYTYTRTHLKSVTCRNLESHTAVPQSRGPLRNVLLVS